MKKFGTVTTAATVAASALTAELIGLSAPAQAAPSGTGNAQETISQLESEGYNVIVNRIGNAPLDQANVLAVRTGQTYTQTNSQGVGHDLNTRVLNKTVYVDVK
ncbi:hypothetical protein BST23_24510 [Mycolicibacterium elephantis]|uniref:PASTA domain-containing protein n=1 Tax=Mycolicibacterium elephantis TaxID=81858 RepID=A0A1X0CGR1_9MYCO|nr:hypothetical protein [Mycolicibacterium elephantis]ORA59397.1 hypothetical protein BST23_24510 [Mycolicibacterium elephantis]